MGALHGLGIGVLSWRAHATLRRSLESYAAAPGFLDLFGDRVVWFSDMTDEDRAIAAAFGWRAEGGPNAGIAAGMKRLARAIPCPYVLLLQNDNPLVESADFARAHLEEALALLEDGRVDLVRMRHRWMVGEQFSDVDKYLRYHPARAPSPEFRPEAHATPPSGYADGLGKRLRRLLRPIKARRLVGRAVFVEEAPEEIHPEAIERVGSFHVIASWAINFTDQCLMIRRSTFLETFMAHVEAHPSSRRSNGFQAPEICINGPWWRNGGFAVAQGRGLFTHARADGSFREGHPAYERAR